MEKFRFHKIDFIAGLLHLTGFKKLSGVAGCGRNLLHDKENKLYLVLLAIALFWSGMFSTALAQKISPKETEDWSKKPPLVAPGKKGNPPSDAIVLFSGKKDLDKWEHADGRAPEWKVSGKALVVEPRSKDLQTKQKFGDVQLHVEWKTPDPKEDAHNDYGNSGIFLMGLYELQVYESYNYDHEIYYNGQAGSIYKQHIPLVNASLPPKTWQTFDIIFEAPEFNEDKSLKKPAYMTVFHNGILILNHVELKGPMKYQGYPEYEYHESKLPLLLQEHKSRVSFRNIWVRELE